MAAGLAEGGCPQSSDARIEQRSGGGLMASGDDEGGTTRLERRVERLKQNYQAAVARGRPFEAASARRDLEQAVAALTGTRRDGVSGNTRGGKI
jgi:hypothetical protein